MNTRSSYCRVLCLALALLGCENPFDARGPLEQKMAVFSILSTDQNVQFVRVEQGYMPEQFDPTSFTDVTYLTDAQVTVNLTNLPKVTSRTWVLRDTVLPRADTSRYKYPVHAFTAKFRPIRGGSYRVEIVHPRLGTVSAIVNLPNPAGATPHSSSKNIFSTPRSYSDSSSIVFILGMWAPAFICRMYVDYEVLLDGEWTTQRVEIPAGYQSSDSHDYAHVFYPGLVRTGPWFPFVTFKNELYQKALANVAYDKYLTNKIIFDRVVMQIVSVDSNLCKYLSPDVDPHSMRLDAPMYYKIDGGFGVLGGYSLDSTVFLLPEDFSFNH